MLPKTDASLQLPKSQDKAPLKKRRKQHAAPSVFASSPQRSATSPQPGSFPTGPCGFVDSKQTRRADPWGLTPGCLRLLVGWVALGPPRKKKKNTR